MAEGKTGDFEARALGWLGCNWKLVTLLSWLAFCGWSIFWSWSKIRWFGLGDTDDNMRIMQVRALLHGQGWYDLRNYRLNPSYGATIHWSRLVVLPIAGLILGLRPFLGGAGAERWAVAIAPLLPYLLLLLSLGRTARRLLGPAAYPWAILGIWLAASTNGCLRRSGSTTTAGSSPCSRSASPALPTLTSCAGELCSAFRPRFRWRSGSR